MVYLYYSGLPDQSMSHLSYLQYSSA